MDRRAARWNAVAAAFDALVELDPAARAARLAQLRGEDPALAEEVATLLRADGSDVPLLDGDALQALPNLHPGERDDMAAGHRIGAYRLVRRLGEGGMGVVWLAERADGGFEQTVALKLLKRGMDTHAILHRFLQERRILARLAHPHIVRLHDGGMSDDGRPYYVMDYVDGEPLTTWAAGKQLDVRVRVELLAAVADAVAYAHAQLVVHRDLKPSNVMVDADGAPRVLDFGIAKLLEPDNGQAHTDTGLRVLSPAYAAPEQILGEPIGTATDVYALGLLLCELLVGRLPHQRAATVGHLVQTVGDEPTERASALAARLARGDVAALYGSAVDARRLARELGGDLDLIIATALQREPARRYATAAAMAGDLRRWLAGRPIAARADSAAYRARRFVRRHRLGVAAGVLVALSLLGGLGAALWQARIASAEAQRAEAARASAEQALLRSERVKQFILALFHEQDPVARARAQARTPAELVREGIAEVDRNLAGEAALQAELLRDLGEIQLGVDEPAHARDTLQRAWELHQRVSGEDSAAAAETLAAYAEAVYAAKDVATAEPLLREAIRRLQDAAPDRLTRLAQVESTLALIELVAARKDQAERLARHALDLERRADDGHGTQLAARLATLGMVQQESGRYDEALASYREALAIVAARNGPDHARAALLHVNVADVLRVQRHYPQALVEYEAALRIERRQLPAGHRLIGITLIRLGDLQRRMQQLDAADRSLSEAITILAPAKSGQYAQALQFHATLARARGDFTLAVQRYGESFEAFRAVTGDSLYTWLTALMHADALVDAGRLDDAERRLQAARSALARMPPDEYAKLYATGVGGRLHHAQGRIEAAIQQRRVALEGLLAMYGAEHADVQEARVALASSLLAAHAPERRSEAADLLQAAHAVLAGRDDPDARALVGSALLERGRLRHATGDLAGARGDIVQALRELQLRPGDARRLREARAFARGLGLATTR